MPRIEFTAKAAEDLKEIGRHTKQQWGLDQVRRYRQELELGLRILSLSPGLGVARNEVAEKVRSFHVASHIAFYLPRNDGITVLRLLHPRRSSRRIGNSIHLCSAV